MRAEFFFLGLNRSYFYQTGHFDPNNLRTSELEETKASGSHAVFAKCTQNYEKIVAEESAQNEPIKWYTSLWLASPVKPALDTFMLGFKRTFSCCQKESGKYPCCQQSQSSQIALPYSTYYQTKLTCDLSINLAYRKISPLNKIFFILSSIVGIGLSGYALYVTIVACGATLVRHFVTFQEFSVLSKLIK